jgi:hypothetical protein
MILILWYDCSLYLFCLNSGTTTKLQWLGEECKWLSSLRLRLWMGEMQVVLTIGFSLVKTFDNGANCLGMTMCTLKSPMFNTQCWHSDVLNMPAGSSTLKGTSWGINFWENGSWQNEVCSLFSILSHISNLLFTPIKRRLGKFPTNKRQDPIDLHNFRTKRWPGIYLGFTCKSNQFVI